MPTAIGRHSLRCNMLLKYTNNIDNPRSSQKKKNTILMQGSQVAVNGCGIGVFFFNDNSFSFLSKYLVSNKAL